MRYCSRSCQKKHWGEHKILCTAIKNISLPTERGLGDSVDENVFMSHLTPSQQSTVAKLVGEKCHVRCELNGMETNVLWDRGGFRGSQISHTTNVKFSHFPNFHKHLHSTLLGVIWYSALTCWRN